VLKSIIENRLDAFEKKYDYSMNYARRVLELGAPVYTRFYRATQISDYDGALPRSAWYAAQLVGIIAGDCGPCTQLVVQLAEESGMPAEQIRSVVEGRFEDLPDDVSLCARFAHALIERSPHLPGLRDEVLTRFGLQGQVALAYAVIGASMYPTLKYAIGHGKPCSTVTVGEEDVSVGSAKTVARRFSQVG
jgi:hypothetical protein